MAFSAFDADRSTGALRRFYPESGGVEFQAITMKVRKFFESELRQCVEYRYQGK